MLQTPSARRQATALKIAQLCAIAASLFVAWHLWQTAPVMGIAVVFWAVLSAWAAYAILAGRNHTPGTLGQESPAGIPGPAGAEAVARPGQLP